MALFCVSKTSIFLFILVCILVSIRESNARPPWLASNSGVFTESAECHTDDELLDLCQRCAKLTKSRLAYPPVVPLTCKLGSGVQITYTLEEINTIFT